MSPPCEQIVTSLLFKRVSDVSITVTIEKIIFIQFYSTSFYIIS